jgi:hypothetical protein
MVHGRGSEHLTFETELFCVWEVGSLWKTRRGLAERSEDFVPLDIIALARVWEALMFER